jgi:dCTP deaminase
MAHLEEHWDDVPDRKLSMIYATGPHGLLSDCAIMAEEGLVITPMYRGPCPKGTISYGLASFGYDLRLGSKYKVFTNAKCATVDPKQFDPRSFVDVEGDYCLIPPNSFALAESMEYLQIPRHILGLCIGKSTYARCGIITPMTPLEPEWRGRVTIEISNTTPLPAKVYSFEGICQVLFFRSPFSVERSYQDKNGCYQDQRGLMLPVVN